MNQLAQTKPRPETDEYHTARQCSKCGGTGFYCQGVVNGRPVSNTGFTCFSCGGDGWQIVWKRGAKKQYFEDRKAAGLAEPILNDDGKVIGWTY